MSTELVAEQTSPRRRRPRTAGAPRDVLRAPVGGAQAALSILATVALVGMWAAQSERAASRQPVMLGIPSVPVVQGAGAVGSDALEFTATGLLAGVVSVDNGPVIPVLGVRPEDLRDTFGDPRDAGERRHAGIDIGAPRGTPVAAALDGWIVALSNGAVGGIGLHLLDRTGTWLLYYSHLDGYRDDVYPGLAVRRGELLGYVGATGNAGGWPHLHFEAGRITSPATFGARPVNPYEFLLGR
jgi:peptidoglycan LD-endopeptidase LytH